MYANNPESLPEDGNYWMILTQTSVHIPGDERSRTAPGHGYPARTEHYPQIQYFTDKEDWIAAIKLLMHPQFGPPKAFRALYVVPMTVHSHIELEVSEKRPPARGVDTDYDARHPGWWENGS